MATAGVTHDITLASGSTKYGFMIQPGSYRSERIDDFAPRIATGTDSKTREGYWDSYTQASASEGIDQNDFSNINKISKSDGNVFTDIPGSIQLDSSWATVDAGQVCTAPMIINFLSSHAVAGVGTKIRRTADGVTWSNSVTTLSANAVWLHQHGVYLFVAAGGAADFYRSTDADTFTQPSAGVKATCFTTWNKSDGTINLVMAHDAFIKVSTDNGATFGAAINVGNASTKITGLVSGFGYLLIGKEDGLWRYDGTFMVDIVLYPTQPSATNFRSIVTFDGFVYTHMLGRILKLALSSGSVSSLVDITPEMVGSSAKELYGHGAPVWLFAGPFVLYLALNGGQNVYPELLAYSGSGWHQRYLGTSSVTMSAAGYSSNFTRMYINPANILARRQISLRDVPFASYDATGAFETSDFTGDLPFMQKAFRAVNIEARNLATALATPRTITVAYSTDKGTTFQSMGTVTANGRTNIPFVISSPSTLSDSATVNSNSMRLKFTLNRGTTTTETPSLIRYSVDFLNRPSATHAHTVNLRLGTTMTLRDGTLETVSVKERLQFVRDIEDSESPIRFIDMIGRHYMVYITKTTVAKVEKETEDERLVTIVMVDAVTGLWPQIEKTITLTVVATAELLDPYYTDFDVFDSPTKFNPQSTTATCVFDTDLHDITLTRQSARFS